MIICLSCHNGETYYQFKELKDIKWSKFDTLVFEIDSTSINPGMAYDINLEILNNPDYAYENLWLYLRDDFESRTPILYEIEYMLADKQGNWYGAGFGSIYQLEVPYKKNIIFKEKRNYLLKIVQGMRDEPLFGIEKVGVKIQPSGHS